MSIDAQPSVASPESGASKPAPAGYRPISALTGQLKRLIIWGLFAFALTVLFNWWHDAMRFTPASTRADDGEGQLGAVLMLLVASLAAFVLTLAILIVELIWIHRANSNARALGAQGMQFTPGWSVGWWFIPGMNFFMPYLAMKEIYKASSANAGPTDWAFRPAPATIAIWWATWVVACLTGQVFSHMSGADDPEIATWSHYLGLLSLAVQVVSAWAFWRILDHVTTQQSVRAAA